jgi:hypothetical protein
MSNKNGAISWTDSSETGKEQKNSKDLFLRLDKGSNVVRMLTVPHQYHQHKYIVDGGRKYGYRINCSRTETTSCPVCDKGDRAKRRWLVGVIDRKTNSYKVLDISYSVFKSIKTLAVQDDWGDPSKYDIDIVVDPDGGATGYYTVVPKPPKPLSAGDLVIRQENDVADLERRSKAPETSWVVEKLAKIAEEISSNGSASSAEDDEEDSSETFFKNYDESGTKKPARANPFSG